MPDQAPSYWFHTKRYGWGWGLPARPAGWVVLISYLVLSTVAGIVIAPRSMPVFLLAMLGLSAGLIAVCYAKGEPPKWRS